MLILTSVGLTCQSWGLQSDAQWSLGSPSNVYFHLGVQTPTDILGDYIKLTFPSWGLYTQDSH